MSDLDPTTRREAETSESFAVAATLELTTTFNAAGEVVRAGLPNLDEPLRIGDVVGDRYEIRTLLGHGGCGYVYAVHDRELDVEVALKTLRPDIRMDPEAAAQLKREIQLARRVTHANICRIFDVGFHDDRGALVPFLTMEKLEGPTLADRLLDKGTLAIEELAVITRQLVAGLEAAHRAGVVHADLKPGNIMLARSAGEMRVVITDFGLATAQAVDLDAENYVLGTPAYMAPEQVESRPLSPATDYYALGCTLYHAATGDVPFRESGVYATALARLERDPVPPRERVELPRIWDEIIMGLLARAPADRLDGAGLLRILDPPKQTSSRLSVGLGLLGISLLALALLWSRSDRADPLELSMPADPEAARLVERAEELNALGAPAAAIAQLERARERGPDHPRIHAALARAYGQSQSRLGTRHAREAARLAVGDSERRFYQALAHLFGGEYAEAAALLEDLDRAHPDTYVIGFLLAESRRRAGGVDLARATLEGLDPPDEARALELLFTRIELEFDKSDYAEALRLARELSARARHDGQIAARSRAEYLVAVSLRQLGDLDGSAAAGRRALELARRSDEPTRLAQAHKPLLAFYMARNQYAEALVHLDGRRRALERLERDYDAAKLEITRAEILADTGRTAEALEHLATAALPGLRASGTVYWEGYAMLVRAEIRRSRGETARALDDCGAGKAVFRGLDNPRLAAFADTICAVTLIDTGELEGARRALDDAVTAREKLGLDILVAQNRVDRGELALAAGDPERAATEASAAAALFAARSLPNEEAIARELVARARWRAGDRAAARAEIAQARARLEGESARIAQAIAITGLVIEGGAAASEQLAERIASLETAGYHPLAIEATLARARIERELGNGERAGELEAAAMAEARERGLRPYRYTTAVD